MSPADNLVQIIVFTVIAYGVAVVVWHNALWVVSRFTYLNDRGEAAALIVQALTAMAYALFPAGLIMLLTMSLVTALGVFVLASVGLWFVMFRNA